jgi:hypothetical protein
MCKVNGRRTASDGKSSHCLWQGELKSVCLLEITHNILCHDIQLRQNWKNKISQQMLKTIHIYCLIVVHNILYHVIYDIIVGNLPLIPIRY